MQARYSLTLVSNWAIQLITFPKKWTRSTHPPYFSCHIFVQLHIYTLDIFDYQGQNLFLFFFSPILPFSKLSTQLNPNTIIDALVFSPKSLFMGWRRKEKEKPPPPQSRYVQPPALFRRDSCGIPHTEPVYVHSDILARRKPVAICIPNAIEILGVKVPPSLPCIASAVCLGH